MFYVIIRKLLKFFNLILPMNQFQRVTGGFAGGLKRLTSVGSSVSGSGNGSKVKKEEVKVEYSNLPQTIVEQSTLNHVAIVRDVVEAHYKNR